MPSGFRLRDFSVLVLVLLIGQILYSSSSDDTDSDTSNVLSNISGTVTKKIQDAVPQCVFNDHSVSVYLYSQDYPYGVKINKDNIIEMAKLTPDKCVNVLILVHGFTSSANASEFYEISQQCIKQQDTLCLAYDWSIPACSTNSTDQVLQLLSYPSADKNTKNVGKILGEIITTLLDKGMCFIRIEIVGHSLGAHVAGFCGKWIKEHSNRTVNKITGLDPAGPGFTFKDKADRLSIGDADLVMAVHTSPLGLQECIGHTDVYVNGGRVQPGCSDLNVGCSHSFSLMLFRSCMDCECIATPFPLNKDFCPPSSLAQPLPTSCCTDGTCGCSVIGLGSPCPFNETGLLGMVTPETAPFCNSNTTYNQCS